MTICSNFKSPKILITANFFASAAAVKRSHATSAKVFSLKTARDAARQRKLKYQAPSKYLEVFRPMDRQLLETARAVITV